MHRRPNGRFPKTEHESEVNNNDQVNTKYHLKDKDKSSEIDEESR